MTPLEQKYESIRLFMEHQVPFNQVLGIQIQEIRDGFAAMHIPFRDTLIGDTSRPAIHGGVLSALADVVAGTALLTQLEMGDRLSTVDLRIDYLRPAGKADLRGEATVSRIGNRIGVARVAIYGSDPEELVGEGSAVYQIKRSQKTEN